MPRSPRPSASPSKDVPVNPSPVEEKTPPPQPIEPPAQPTPQAQPEAAAQNPAPIVPKKSSKKGCCIGCGIVGLVLLVGFGISAVSWAPSLLIALRTGTLSEVLPSLTALEKSVVNQTTGQNNNTTASESTLKLITGKSTGTLPYAPIDEARIVTRMFSSKGGVLKAELPKNVIAYYIMPEGGVIQDATVSLIPYTEMPTQPSHGGMSDDYGYGVQVETSSAQMGITGYLVFDTTGGKATEEAAAKGKYFNRCDPRFTWFDPYLCAKGNKVAATTVVTKDQTIVTPIHEKNYNKLVFTDNTIPMGIDGLLVTEVKGGDVFIPQKLDAALARKLVGDTVGKNSSDTQMAEAAALALAWNVTNFSSDQLTQVSQMNGGRTYQEQLKTIYVLSQFIKGMKNHTYGSVGNGFADESDYNDMTSQFEGDMGDLGGSLVEDITGITKDFGFGIDSVEASAAVGDAVDLGVDGASQAAATVDQNIGDGQTSPYGQPEKGMDAAEGSTYRDNNDNFDPDVVDAKERAQTYVDSVLGNPDASIADYLKAAQTAQQMGLDAEANQLMQKAQAKAREDINKTLNDPNATIADLLRAAQLAQELGLSDAEEITNKVMDKIKKILEDELKKDLSKGSCLDDAALSDQLGFTDLADSFRKKASDALTAEYCDLVKKTLKNFGVNECN